MALALPMLVGLVACESMPARTMRGARHYAAGSAALEAGDSRVALAELERAAELVPHASEIQNHLGLAHWAEGETKQARKAFDRALELDCDNEAARRGLAALDEVERGLDSISRPDTEASLRGGTPDTQGSADDGG